MVIWVDIDRSIVWSHGLAQAQESSMSLDDICTPF
jgi:hypothetical protein